MQGVVIANEEDDGEGVPRPPKRVLRARVRVWVRVRVVGTIRCKAVSVAPGERSLLKFHNLQRIVIMLVI